MKERDDALVRKVLATLDKSVQTLDPETVTRLRHIRTEAVERGTSRVWKSLGPLFRFPAASLATAAAVLLAAFLYFFNPFGTHVQNGVDVPEMLVTHENLEFYEQLDFYRWLTEEAGNMERETRSGNSVPRYAALYYHKELATATRADEEARVRVYGYSTISAA